MAYDGSLIFDTKIDSSGFQNGVKSLDSAAEKGVQAVTATVAAAGVALVGLGAKGVQVGMDFEAGMSQVAATMGTTIDKIDDLSEIAKKMGASTKFSATEAANALNYLALAGYDSKQQIAALPTVLNLAAAGEMDLAYASDLVTDSMAALGLEMTELESYSDSLARTAQRSNTSVSQLGEAVLVCGGQAKLAGLDVTQMNTALGILADNGIKGSEGGTALRNAIKNLYTPTNQASKMIESLGVATQNSDGSMRKMQDVLQDLNGSLGNLTEADRLKAMNEIFDTRTIAAANALLKDSGARWDELSAEIANADGACSDMAATMNDNLKGRITELNSALEGLGIQFYESIDSPLKSIAETGIDYVGRLSGAFSENGLSGMVEAAGSIFADIVQKIAEYAPMIIETAVSMVHSFVLGLTENKDVIIKGAFDAFHSLLSGIKLIIPELMPLAIDAITALVQGFIEYKQFIITAGIGIITSLAQGLAENADTLIEQAKMAIFEVADCLIANAPIFIEAAVEIIAKLASGLGKTAPRLIPTIVKIIDVIINGLLDNLDLLLGAALALITGLADGLIAAIPVLVQALPNIIDKIVAFLKGSIPQLIETGITLFKALIDAIPAVIDALVIELPKIIMSIIDGLLSKLPMLVDGAIQLFMAIIDAIPIIIEILVPLIPQIVISITTALLENLPILLEAAVQLFMALVMAIPQIVAALVANIPTIITAIMDGLGSLSPLISEFINSIVEFFAELPDKIWQWLKEATAKIAQWGTDIYIKATTAVSETINKVVSFFKEMPGKIWEWLVNTVTKVAQWGADMRNKAISATSEMINSVVGFFKGLPDKIWEWLKKSVTKVVQWGADMQEKAKTAVTNVVNGIIEWFSKLPADIATVGKNLIEGLWNGISNAAEWLFSKISGFVDQVMDKIKGFFGIKSPSRLFRDQIGKNLALGIGVGFEVETPKVTDSMLDDLDNMTAKLTTAVDFEASAHGGKAALSDWTSSSSYDNRSYDNRMNVTFTGQVESPSQVERKLRNLHTIRG